MNQMRNRLQALNMLDRALAATDDATLELLVAGLDEAAHEALASVIALPSTEGHELSVAGLRAAAERGRMNGGLEGIAYALSEKCLDDCIGQLGDSSDNPSATELNAVLPGLIERHSAEVTRLMLASVNVGDAPAAPLLRDVLKHHELLALPPVVERLHTAPVAAAVVDPAAEAERAAVKARRVETKQRKQAEARARREQAERARHKA